MLRLWLGAFISVGTLTTSPLGAPPPPASVSLTNASQLLRLTPAQAAERQPVRLEGVVTCFHASERLLFVQDASAGLFVWSDQVRSELEVGHRVAVSGVSAPGRFSPIVSGAKVELLGKGRLPEPRLVSLAQAASGSQDCQWVEVEGVVRASAAGGAGPVLELATGSSRLEVRLLASSSSNHLGLITARVKAQGVVAGRFDEQGRLRGFNLLVPRPEHLIVVEPPRADLFGLPVQPIASLGGYAVMRDPDRPVRVQGSVLLHWPGRMLFLRDQTGGVRVQVRSGPAAAPGDVVDAVGFVARRGNATELEDGTFQVAGHGAIAATCIDASQIHAEFNSALVQFEAVLLGKDFRTGRQPVLLCRAGDRVLYANLPPDAEPLSVAAWPDGARLRLTGVCEVPDDPAGRPASCSVWLPSVRDVELLQRPRDGHGRPLLGLVGLLSAGWAAGWVWLTRQHRRLEARSRALAEREGLLEARYNDLFENSRDIVFAHDLEGRLTELNHAGEVATGYSRAEVLGRDVAQIVAPACRELVRQKLNEKLAGAPRTTYELEILAKDGQPLTLEVSARLEFKDGKPAGVRGVARDITRRKHSEEALRRSEQRLRQVLLERERLGRDLHDHLIQSIYAIGLGLEETRRQVLSNPKLAESQLASALTGLNHVIRDVRHYILGLQPEALTQPDLESALRALLLGIGFDPHVQFDFKIDADVAAQLAPDQVNSLLHIAREAMSNSLRHASARTVAAAVWADPHGIHLQVRDDGVGFDADSLRHTGRGLRNIRARAEELQARLLVHSRPGEGTCIQVTLPLRSSP